MNEPRNYNKVQAYREFEPLELGGHICQIINVEEMLSSTGKEMIKISLDIAEGRQKNYYRNLYKNDTRENKKWGCVVYQLVHDKNGDANRGFKTFNTSVEESNAGYKTVWGSGYCEALKGKLVGGIFGREQYQKQSGELAWATKCFSFRSIETIRNGVAIPEDRPMKNSGQDNYQNAYSSANQGYYQVEDADDDLPF